MFKISLESYEFDWDIFQSSLIAVGLCVLLVLTVQHKGRLKSLNKLSRRWMVVGVISFLAGIVITGARFATRPPPPVPQEEFLFFETKVERWRVCTSQPECIVIDECMQVQAINRKFEKEYRVELLKTPLVEINGCLKGEPDSRRAQYGAECVKNKCKHIIVKPSTMQEVEDRLNGKFDP